MSPVTSDVFDAALALPDVQRAELADLLVASLNSSGNQLHPDWPAELKRRWEELRDGRVEGVPWETVRRAVRAQLDASGPPHG